MLFFFLAARPAGASISCFEPHKIEAFIEGGGMRTWPECERFLWRGMAVGLTLAWLRGTWVELVWPSDFERTVMRDRAEGPRAGEGQRATNRASWSWAKRDRRLSLEPEGRQVTIQRNCTLRAPRAAGADFLLSELSGTGEMNLDMAEQPCARIDSFVPVVWLPIAAARLEPASGHRWWIIVQVCRHNSAFGDHRHGDGLHALSKDNVGPPSPNQRTPRPHVDGRFPEANG